MDFLSEDFNPELVLGSENEEEVKVPCENVKPLNNLAEYVNKSTKKGDNRRQLNEKARPGPSVGSKGFVQTIFRARKRLKNVLTIMETTDGPLGRLRQCMDEKTRVKVWTRSSHRMRGVCSGFVIAFDRHWNLVLSDADDTYLLPVTKGPQKGAHKEGHLAASDNLQLRERHIGQVFVRGENVAFVSISS